MPETYTHGYSPTMTRFLAGRSAACNAAFFLEYMRPGLRVLDFGCGPGAITVGLAQAAAPGEVIGVDVEAGQIEQAQRLAASQGVSNARFEVASVYALQFPNAGFDAVFGHAVLEHLEEPLRALREARRLLRPGGFAGFREIDGRGHLLYPDNALLHESLRLQELVWRRNGGNPQIGAGLKALLLKAGFQRVSAAASYDHYGTPEGAAAWASRIVDQFSGENFRRQALEAGTDPATLDAMRSAWQEWAARPDAFYARARVEALGWAE